MAFPRSGPPRVVAATTALALLSGAIGWLVGGLVRSPADAAAAHRPPPASLITVAVERRTLTSTVNAQGTVAYGAPQPITLTGLVAGGEGDSTSLITKAPTADRTLHEGDVLLEISGRPVLVMLGTVPMYRTLTRGSTGDDVTALRAALRRLLPGSQVSRSGPLDDQTLRAVRTLYRKRGYQATGPTAAQRTQLRQLQQAVDNAELPTTGNNGQALADAKADLADFLATYGVSIASGEIIFLPHLPVRLTRVSVKAGGQATGVIGTVADPRLVVNGSVSSDDAALLKIGMTATMDDQAGDTFSAILSAKGAAAATTPDPSTNGGGGPGTDQQTGDSLDDATGIPIRLTPKNPTELARFAGQAFKVEITVGGTGHGVLSVPVSAVFTASDGRARVTVQDSSSGRVHDVPVETGLSTGGYVQITPSAAAVVLAGSRVVVGSR